jgi:hypothetical protein
MSMERILGYAPLDDLDGLLALLNAESGPAVMAWHGTHLAALLQAETDDGPQHRIGILNRLATACSTGPFLPQEPSAAVVPAEAVPEILAPAWNALDAALWTHGTYRQWDITLRPSTGTGFAAGLDNERARQETAALRALSPAVLAVIAGEAPHNAATSRITALAPTGAVDQIEAALHGLHDSTFDIDGPMPPLAFAAVQIAVVEPRDVADAWRTLDLDDTADRTLIQRRWRSLAGSLQPACAAQVLSGAMAGIGGLTDAYRILRPLLPLDGSPASLAATLKRAGRRLVVPDPPVHRHWPGNAATSFWPPVLAAGASLDNGPCGQIS